MTDQPKRHVIPEPFPENIGVTAMTIFAPEDFRGDLEVIWWYPGKSDDAHRQRMTCSCAWLLQGVFHDVRGSRPREDLLGSGAAASFDARIVALVLHAFYRARIEAAARLWFSHRISSLKLSGQVLGTSQGSMVSGFLATRQFADTGTSIPTVFVRGVVSRAQKSAL